MKVKVRIAVVIDREGSWSAAGATGLSDKENMKAAWAIYDGFDIQHEFFHEAELDVPEVKTVHGDVVEVKE